MKTFDQFILTEKVLSKSQAFEKFIFGDCGSFAVALVRLLGGGDIKTVFEIKFNRHLHAFVAYEGRTMDVVGIRPKESMIADFVGSGFDKTRFSVQGPFGESNIPLVIKPKAIEIATDYINANRRLYRL